MSEPSRLERWTLKVQGDEEAKISAHFASSITSIPSSCAFLSLEPAPGPAITRSVLADTEPETRSEEHTSELQSLMRISYAVFCLKKKTHIKDNILNVAHYEIRVPVNEYSVQHDMQQQNN